MGADATAGRPVAYLAGPDVFLPDAAVVGAAKAEVCAAHGLVARVPADLPPPVVEPGGAPEAGRRLFEAAAAMMDGCDVGIANLTPFRGTSADVGTAFELGYLLGQGKPVFGYTSEPAHYAERVAPDGLAVERFDLADNLMLEGAVRRAGVPVVRVPAPTGASDRDRLVAMDAFVACVVEAAGALGVPC